MLKAVFREYIIKPNRMSVISLIVSQLQAKINAEVYYEKRKKYTYCFFA